MKFLLNIEDKLWHEFKVKCAQEKKTMTEKIKELIKKYLDGLC